MDILINNAGVANLGTEDEGVDVYSKKAKANMAINYWGTRRVCELMGPVMKMGSRVVMVSSSLSWLGYLVTPCELGLNCGDKVILRSDNTDGVNAHNVIIDDIMSTSKLRPKLTFSKNDIKRSCIRYKFHQKITKPFY